LERIDNNCRESNGEEVRTLLIQIQILIARVTIKIIIEKYYQDKQFINIRTDTGN